MRDEHGFRTLPRAIGKQVRLLAGDLQHGRPERPHKAVRIARAKSGTQPARDRDDRLMSVLPTGISQRACLCGVRRKLGKPNRRIAT